MAEPTVQRDARTRRRLRSRLSLAAVALVASALLAEGAVRVRQWIRHGTFGSIYDFAVDPASGLRIPTPNQRGRIETDSRGFRNPEIVVPKPPGRIRVAFLGGSTTFCAEASSNDATWPSLVVRALGDAHPTREFDLVNASAAAFHTGHSRTNFEQRVAPLEPDVVVIYHATNDLTHDSREAAVAQGIHSTSEESTLERWSLAWSLIRKNLLLRGAGAGARDDTPKLALDAGSLARRFATRLEALVRSCQSRVAVVALATFSHRVRESQTPAERAAACESALYYMPYLTPDDILAAITAYNAEIRRVAADTGCVLIDGEHDIPADAEHFNDSVHLRDAGCRVMAARVVEALEADPRFAALLR